MVTKARCQILTALIRSGSTRRSDAVPFVASPQIQPIQWHRPQAVPPATGDAEKKTWDVKWNSRVHGIFFMGITHLVVICPILNSEDPPHFIWEFFCDVGPKRDVIKPWLGMVFPSPPIKMVFWLGRMV